MDYELPPFDFYSPRIRRALEARVVRMRELGEPDWIARAEADVVKFDGKEWPR